MQDCWKALNICEQASSLMKLNKSTQRNRLTDEELTLILQLTATSITPDLTWHPQHRLNGNITKLL
jgi:hypothetical protein